jgi:hypothetical protein
MNSNRSKQFGKTAATPAEIFLESEDWQSLLQQKFKLQEAAASASADKEPAKKDPSAVKASAGAIRSSVLGA